MSTALSIVNKQSVLESLGRARNILLALVFVLTQLIVPFSFIQPVVAQGGPGIIDVSTHQGQLKDLDGTLLGYTTGSSNITTYKELDSINFRFDLSASVAGEGQMQIEFTSQDTGCLFFDGSFGFGTYDGLVPKLTNVSGVEPTVSANSTPANNGSDWIQLIDVEFVGQGSATVNYHLTLTDEASQCSSGSPQHTRLGNGPDGHQADDFKNIGAQNIPIPAKQILELPSIEIIKSVTGDADPSEFSFSVSPAPTIGSGQTEYVLEPEESSIVIENVDPGKSYTIAESGPDEYVFDGDGTDSLNCTVDTSSVGSPAGVMLVAAEDIEAGRPPTNAICHFSNIELVGSITIEKEAQGYQGEEFSFTASGDDIDVTDESFKLTGTDDKTFPGLSAGEYTFTEEDVTEFGWDLAGISCVDSNGSTVSHGETERSATIDLGAGENITCTFTNQQRGEIIVNKITDPADDMTAFPITLNTDNGVDYSEITPPTVATNAPAIFTVGHGSYSVSEADPAGWREVQNTCSDITIDSSTTLVNGVPTEECTITNEKLASLTIVKKALPVDDQVFGFTTTGLTPATFDLSDNDVDATRSSRTFSDLTPGETFTVTEGSTTEIGWDLTELSCSGDSATTNLADRTISYKPAAGDQVTCTFTNTQLLSIGGIKYLWTENGVSRPTATTPWTIELWELDENEEFVNTDRTTQTDTTNGTFSFTDLLPGTYQLRERSDELAGWTQTMFPADIELKPGDIVEGADFENFEHASVSGYKWNDVNGDGQWNDGEEPIDDWAITLEMQDVDGEWVSYPDSGNNTTLTDESGRYEFTDLMLLEEDDGTFTVPTYRVCENQQDTDWEQTYPIVGDCHQFNVTESGQEFSGNSGVAEDFNFGNRGFGEIIIEKETITTSDEEVEFSFEIRSLDDEDDIYTVDPVSVTGEGTNTTSVVSVPAGQYSVHEFPVEGWDVTDSYCSAFNDRSSVSPASVLNNNGMDTVQTTVEPGQTINCNFVNTQRSSVTVTKFNDFDRDGSWNQDIEPVLEGWEMVLGCESDGFSISEYGFGSGGCDFDDDRLQTTGTDGTTTFENLKSNQYLFYGAHGLGEFSEDIEAQIIYYPTPTRYTLREVNQDGWEQTALYCPEQMSERPSFGLFEAVEDEGSIDIFLSPGQHLDCYVGNAQDLVLELDKENDTPDVTTVGDIVTYTLTVSVPEDSGVSYNTTVVDVPPENFEFIPGTETASQGGLTAAYASPGTWELGTMYPGDEVVLTYQARILDEVTPGTYPDIAYAQGGTEPIREENETVYSNVHLAEADDPFVGTEVTVTVDRPEVLGATTLAKTGSPVLWQYAIVPILLIGLAISLFRRETKGAL